MPVCSRCGTDHSEPGVGDRLLEASRQESREREDIHAMLMRGEDDGRRSSNAAFLRMSGYLSCLMRSLDALPVQPVQPGPTAWEVLLGEDGI